MGIGRSRDLLMGGPGHLGQLGDVMAEVEVDAGDSVGQWWMILHIHIGAGIRRLELKGVNHTSMGSGWHA